MQNWDYRWQGVPHYLTRRERRPRIEHDSSVMTYRGHTVLQTLIRCRFSPVHTTGQRYIYSGCASGAIVSKCRGKNCFCESVRKT